MFAIYFRSLDAEKMMQVLFCDLHSAVVLSDIVRRADESIVMESVSWFTDFVGQLNHAHKSRPTLSFVWHPLYSSEYRTARAAAASCVETVVSAGSYNFQTKQTAAHLQRKKIKVFKNCIFYFFRIWDIQPIFYILKNIFQQSKICRIAPMPHTQNSITHSLSAVFFADWVYIMLFCQISDEQK